MPASTRIIGKNARLYLGRSAFYLAMFEMENTAEFNFDDDTPYGQDWRQTPLIDGQIGMSVNAYMDTAQIGGNPAVDEVTDIPYLEAYDSDMDGIWNDQEAVPTPTTIPITFVPGNTAARGDPCKFFNSSLGSLAISANRNEVNKLRGRFMGRSRYHSGILIAQQESAFTGTTYIPADPNGTDLAAAGVSGVAAALHVYNKSGAANLTVSIEESSTGVGAWTTALTFAVLTTRGTEYKEDTAVAVGKRYHRVKVILASGTETVGLVVSSQNI